jgi:lactoylglutathione lyase
VDRGRRAEDIEMSVSSLKLLVLRTPDPNRLRRFYQVLGIAFAEERHGSGPLHFAGKVGDAILELYPLAAEGASVDSTLRLGFGVTYLLETVLALEAAGATVVSKPGPTAWGTRAVVRDPDGRAVELYEG